MIKLLVLILLMIANLGHAQQAIAEYYSSAFNQKYKILAQPNKTQGEYTLFIRGHSTASSTLEVSLIVTHQNHREFVDNLKKAKDKYMNWSRALKTRKMKKSSMNLSFNEMPYEGAFLLEQGWNKTEPFELQYALIKNGKTRILQLKNKTKMLARDNHQLSTEGFSIIFTSLKEIDDFIAKVEANFIAKFFSN